MSAIWNGLEQKIAAAVKTERRPVAVAFLDAKTGWAVGPKGTIVKYAPAPR